MKGEFLNKMDATILIVEDEQNIREFEVINLRRQGFDTVEADCGETALSLFDLEPETFDIALLDENDENPINFVIEDKNEK